MGENAAELEPRRTRSLQDIPTITHTDNALAQAETDADADDRLAQSMTALSLVPPSIRFGRSGGFVPHARSPTKSVQTTSSFTRVRRGAILYPSPLAAMESNSSEVAAAVRTTDSDWVL